MERSLMSLELRNINRSFNGKTVIRNVSFRAKQGEIIGLVGTSGSGKSTLLRVISGLDTEYEGQIIMNDKQFEGMNSSISFIFQEPRLFPWLNVLENVTFGLKGSKDEKKGKGLKILEQVGLSDSSELYPRELSGGMAQRVAIARALVTSPEILLLDEPFSALDAFTKMQLQDLLLETWESYHPTIILVTHDIDEAIYLCDRVIILRGKPSEVVKEICFNEPRPRNRTSRQNTIYKADILNSLDLTKT
jgi:sulfonate transport system ATP-binding protein